MEIVTRENFLVVVLAGFVLFIGYILKDEKVFWGAFVIAAIAFIYTNLRGEKIVLSRE